MRRLLTVILIFPSFFSSSQLDLETIATEYPIAKEARGRTQRLTPSKRTRSTALREGKV